MYYTSPLFDFNIPVLLELKETFFRIRTLEEEGLTKYQIRKDLQIECRVEEQAKAPTCTSPLLIYNNLQVPPALTHLTSL